MKDPSSSGRSREGRRESHREMPLRDGYNKDVDSGRRRRNKQDLPSSLGHDEVYKHTPWLELIPERQYLSPEQRLHDEIVAYTKYMHPTPQERTARQAVLTCIQDIVHRFMDGKVNVFGSCATGLWLPTSDIDIAISTNGVTDQSKKSVLFQLSSRLKSSGLTPYVLVNHHARVPILKLTARPEYGSLNVDIGINNTDGIKGVGLINGFLTKLPALRPLILVVKGFLAQRSLNDASKSGLGSYAMNPSKRAPEFLDNPMENESLGLLLGDFFFYYGLEFPYSTSYICVAEGKVLPKESAEWIKQKDGDHLAIQCLVKPDIDVGKSLNRTNTLQRVFKEGYTHILQLTMLERNTLGGLVSVNKQMLSQRSQIFELFNSPSGAVQPCPLPYNRKMALSPSLPRRPRSRERREYEYGRGRGRDEYARTKFRSSYRHDEDGDTLGGRESSRPRGKSHRWENRP